MTREFCEGAFAAGCEDLLIKDAHDSARNLIPAELPERVSIFRGWGSDSCSALSPAIPTRRQPSVSIRINQSSTPLPPRRCVPATGDLGVCAAKRCRPFPSEGCGNGSISIHPAEAVKRIREKAPPDAHPRIC